MNPVRAIVPQSILAWLCHYANADPSRTFYDFKDRLLHQYADFQGHDIQEIVKECWGSRDHWGDPRGCKGEECRRCNGTGIYDRRWVRLQRWKWGKYIFHIPISSTYIQPDSIQIHGRIIHDNYGKASREAELWLYIVTLQFSMWWRLLSTRAYVDPGLWPMCRFQRIAMWARMTFRWHRCWCGKWFPTWGTGWMACKKCRQTKTFLDQDNDVPF